MEKWFEFTVDRPYHDLRYRMDSRKLNNLGWFPKIGWEEGMERTSEFNKFKKRVYS